MFHSHGTPAPQEHVQTCLCTGAFTTSRGYSAALVDGNLSSCSHGHLFNTGHHAWCSADDEPP